MLLQSPICEKISTGDEITCSTVCSKSNGMSTLPQKQCKYIYLHLVSHSENSTLDALCAET